MSANNALVFEPIRRWLDADGYTPARVSLLDVALARFRAKAPGPDRNKLVFDQVRDWLDERGFTAERIAQLDAALADYSKTWFGQSGGQIGAVMAGLGGAGLAPLIPAASPILSSGFADQAAEDRFFEAVRKSGLFPRGLDQSQVDGIKAKCAAYAIARWPLAYAAYGMETSHHETGAKMQPVPEGGRGRGHSYGRPGKHHGQIAYGRGDVQLTWDYNYEKADADLRLGGALIANYELALRPDISARIMVSGMSKGWFTGKRLGSYLPPSGPATYAQFRESRRIINGTDRADLLAGNAMKWQACFQAGGWR